MNWREHIAFDPGVCDGAPCFKGTGVPVAVVLENLAAGRTTAEILVDHPSLWSQAIPAALAYAAEVARTSVWSRSLLHLLKETFEKGGSLYLEERAGLLPMLDTISADIASRAPFPGAHPIVAHCAHLGYYVRANLNSILGQEQELDWPASWRVQHVGPEEWTALKATLRGAYDDLRAAVASLPVWRDYAVCDTMAIFAHTACHLGAIRQIRRVIESGPN